jgi:excinuclease UvrABC nuclease subunit
VSISLTLKKGEEEMEKFGYEFEISKIKLEDKKYMVFVKNARSMFESLKGKCGLYLLYNDNLELMYIGKSKKLETRIVNSLCIKGMTHFRTAFTETLSDMSVYEVYYISKLKPPLNKESKHIDELTLKLPELTFSEIKKATIIKQRD